MEMTVMRVLTEADVGERMDPIFTDMRDLEELFTD
jgi:hypothetical protein